MNVNLIMVDPTNNHNKFYNMTQMPGGTFEARYGRVGAAEQVKIYPMNRWDTIYQQKISKGYTDVTRLRSAPGGSSRYKKIENESVRLLMDNLMRFSSKVIRENYTVSDDAVTEDMLSKAQHLLSELAFQRNINSVNEMLLKIYSTIPRRMYKVSDFMCSSITELQEIIQREQDVLDVMSAKVGFNKKTSTPSADKTICDELGIEVTPVSEEEEKRIRRHLNNDENSNMSGMFKHAWRVKNHKTDERFSAFMKENGYTDKDIHFLYHGSRNQNWLGIVSEGLSLNPNAVITGKMFGHGLYFAKSPKKSLGYTSITGSRWANGEDNIGYIALYRVLYKNPLNVYEYKTEYSSYRKLKKEKDALYAHKGKMLYNDEIVVYNEKQVQLEYLIEIGC